MDGSDRRFLQRFERLLQPLTLNRVCRGRSSLVELLSEPDLQLAGCLMGEGDGHKAIHSGRTLGQHLHDARHQLCRLAGSGGRFDNEALPERLADDSPSGCVGARTPL